MAKKKKNKHSHKKHLKKFDILKIIAIATAFVDLIYRIVELIEKLSN